jgi:enoyl-CoA hydratase/carnithine racemase
MLKKPIIAAINGFSLGGGCEMSLACDLLIMKEHAQIGLPEVLRGLAAGAGGNVRLPRRIPPTIALEAILTGKPFTAQRALELGLVNRVVPNGEGWAPPSSWASPSVQRLRSRCSTQGGGPRLVCDWRTRGATWTRTFGNDGRTAMT